MRWKFENAFKTLLGVFAALLLWSIWASAQSQTGSATIEFTQSRYIARANARMANITLRRSGNTNVVLSWATNFTGFTLQANTNLNTNVWSVVSPAPAVSGTNNVVTNATTEAQKFYRLSKP